MGRREKTDEEELGVQIAHTEQPPNADDINDKIGGPQPKLDISNVRDFLMQPAPKGAFIKVSSR